MSGSRKFPSVVYVTKDEEGILYASEHLFDVVDDGGEKTTVGTYQLQETTVAMKVVKNDR